MAQTASRRSKDTTKVGAVIADKQNRIVGTGYNGMEPGVIETTEMWKKPQKYSRVRHAEINALNHSVTDVRGCTLATTLFPCAACAAAIGNAGIKRVLYLDGAYDNKETRIIFEALDIELIKLEEYK